MNIDLIKKYNRPGPRYTSYPPATSFHSGFTDADYKKHILKSNTDEPNNISFYVHIPFCSKMCLFCGCNTSLLKGDDVVNRYVNAIIKEIETVSNLLDKNRKISQIHWGGGTPNSISLDYIEKIMNTFQSKFLYTEKAEIAMECNPAYLEFEDIDRLAEIGFNRLSLGIQDFDSEILKLVNRDSSKHPVNELVNHMKKAGFKGVNLDLIYGLPHQTVESFAKSVKQAIEISPHRLVTFSYAHVPWVKVAQKKLETYGLPNPEEKLAMFDAGMQLLTKAGYVAIGMDHYAKPNDELSIALKNKKLHRNFQGYATRETTAQVYGFGASSISQLNGAYIQNLKSLNKYMESVEAKGFAVERGYEMTDNEIITRDVITNIMCNGYFNFTETANNFNISDKKLKEILEFSEDKLKEFIDDDLIKFNGEALEIQNDGFLIVRNIAMAFDPLLETSENKFSKTV
ncbi:MAG: oxygen-independent coproporphyrinogen III oxidase [Bacteroidales bacterium]|nr:oxygen-independent coproporphyrinogen III oxidase [Bacteroidales bacterium]MBN2756226.1 oxygen-independent coproporphyrinogen III oxidase [Bacteroidales bacterium]